MSKLLKVSAITGAVGLALYAGIGYFVVPYAVKTGIEKVGSSQLKQSVTLDNISFNPWTWELQLEGLTIGKAEQPLVHLKSFYVDVSSKSVTQLAPVIDAVKIDSLQVNANLDDPSIKALTEQSSSNSAKKEEKPAKSSDGSLPKFAVYNISMVNSSITIESAKDNIHQSISDINLELPFVSTLAASQESLVTPALSMKINGTPIFAKGTTKPFGSTLEATLTAEIKNLDLVPFASFVPALKDHGLTLKSGTASTNTTIVFRNPTGSNPGKMIVSGDSSVNNVSLTTSNGELFGVNQLRVQLDHVDLIGHDAAVKSILIDNPRVQVTHTKQGIVGVKSVNFHNQPAAKESKPAASSNKSGADWTWSIKQVNVSNGYLNWNDRSMSRPAQVTVSKLNLGASNLSSKGDTNSDINLSLSTLGGSIAVNGTVNPKTMNVALAAKAQRLNAQYINPYILHFMGVDIKAVTDVNVKVSGTPSALVANGSLAVDRFALGNNKDIPVRFQHFDIQLDKIDTKNKIANVGSVTLNKANINFILTKSGNNITDLFAKDEKKAGKDAKQEAKSDAKSGQSDWNWSVGKIALTDSTFRFQDSTKAGNPAATLTHVNTFVGNLSSKPKTISTLDVSANLGNGIIRNKGQFSIDPVAANMQLSLDKVPMKNISDLMLAYSGIGAGSGLVNLDGQLQLVSGKETAVDWKGNVLLKDFNLLGSNKKTLMTWKAASLENMSVHTAKPVSFEIARASIDSPGLRGTNEIKKASQAIGLLAQAFGEKKVAKEMNRVNSSLEKVLVLTDVSYKNGNLTANGHSTNALADMLLSKLGAELGKVLK